MGYERGPGIRGLETATHSPMQLVSGYLGDRPEPISMFLPMRACD
jgi:hypothetical protein